MDGWIAADRAAVAGFAGLSEALMLAHVTLCKTLARPPAAVTSHNGLEAKRPPEKRCDCTE